MAHVKYGVALGRLNPAFFAEVTVEAERLGYESVWLPEHLVFPVTMAGSPHPGDDHPPVPPQTPAFDAWAYLSFLAGRTSRIRLATHVYNLGLRHPFVAARAIATCDIVSNGRVECGIGASWLREEWVAAGVGDWFDRRGRVVDECLAVCRRLWTEEVIEHHGEFYDFAPVMFEPKPVQARIPVHVGGESNAALRRAARFGDGWVGMSHTFESIVASVGRIRAEREAAGLADRPVEITIGGRVDGPDDVARWSELGVDRLIVSPWRRSREAVDGLRAFADLVGIAPPAD